MQAPVTRFYSCVVFHSAVGDKGLEKFGLFQIITKLTAANKPYETPLIMNTAETSHSRYPFSCPGHVSAKSNSVGADTIPVDKFQGYFPLITQLDFSSNSIVELPTDFDKFAAISCLKLSRNLIKSLPSFQTLSGLRQCDLSFNRLSAMPDMKMCASLQILNLESNPLMTFPKQVLEIPCLSELNITNTGLSSLPEDIGKLTSLTSLQCGALALTSLPKNLSRLTCLTRLDLSGLRWLDVSGKNALVTKDDFQAFLQTNVLMQQMSKPVSENLIKKIIFFQKS